MIESDLYIKYWKPLIGYDIQSNKTGIIYSKGEFWERFKSVAIRYAETGKMHSNFKLIQK